MLTRRQDEYEITISHDPTYTYGSADNPQTYGREYRLTSIGPNEGVANLAIRVSDEVEEIGSSILLASGGVTAIHRGSVLFKDDVVFLAVGPIVAAVSIPGLDLIWTLMVDRFQCEELHHDVKRNCLVSRGSNEIMCFNGQGTALWTIDGSYRYSKGFTLREDVLEITDWDDQICKIDLLTGLEIPT